MKDMTTGTDLRQPRSMDPSVLGVDLMAEAERLRGEPSWAAHGRAAKTLAKAPQFRVVLSLLRAGREIGEDDAWAPLAVQVLRGSATASRGQDGAELDAGGLAWFGEGPGWRVRATEDAVLLISMSWPEERAADATDREEDPR